MWYEAVIQISQRILVFNCRIRVSDLQSTREMEHENNGTERKDEVVSEPFSQNY